MCLLCINFEIFFFFLSVKLLYVRYRATEQVQIKKTYFFVCICDILSTKPYNCERPDYTYTNTDYIIRIKNQRCNWNVIRKEKLREEDTSVKFVLEHLNWKLPVNLFWKLQYGGSGSGGSIINWKKAVDNLMRHCENFSLHHIKGLHASAICIVQAPFLQQCWEDLYTYKHKPKKEVRFKI